MRIFLWILAAPVVYLFLGTFMVYANRAIMGVAMGLFWMDDHKKFNFKKFFLMNYTLIMTRLFPGLMCPGCWKSPYG